MKDCTRPAATWWKSPLITSMWDKPPDCLMFTNKYKWRFQSVASHLSMLFTQMYAGDGLRTLVLASKDLDESYMKEWRKRHNEASTAMEDREERLEELYEEIEKDMTVITLVHVEYFVVFAVSQHYGESSSLVCSCWEQQLWRTNCKTACRRLLSNWPKLTSKSGCWLETNRVNTVLNSKENSSKFNF